MVDLTLFASEWYNSPFIVPVAGCAMIGSIAVAGISSGVRSKEIASQERLARIAQGLPAEPEWDQEMLRQAVAGKVDTAKAGRPSDGAGARRAGLILCCLGAGLFVFFAFLAAVLRELDVFSGAASGILPLAIGIGFLIDASHRRRDFERWMAAVSAGSPDAAGGAGTEGFAGAAPPPPMTPAQASDWRPLH